MVITAHWIKHIEGETVSGTKLTLRLQSDLVGFQNISGHYTGEHMAHVFLHVTDYLKLIDKVLLFKNS